MGLIGRVPTPNIFKFFRMKDTKEPTRNWDCVLQTRQATNTVLKSAVEVLRKFARNID